MWERSGFLALAPGSRPLQSSTFEDTAKMRSRAANSASINPAASCAHPFPLGCADSFLSISSSNASWSLCCRAIAGVVGRPQCTINDSLSFSRRPARPAYGRRRPATHRKIYKISRRRGLAGPSPEVAWGRAGSIYGSIDAYQPGGASAGVRANWPLSRDPLDGAALQEPVDRTGLGSPAARLWPVRCAGV